MTLAVAHEDGPQGRRVNRGGQIAGFVLAGLLGVGLWVWSQPGEDRAAPEPREQARGPSAASESTPAPEPREPVREPSAASGPAPVPAGSSADGESTPREPGDMSVASGMVLPIALADLAPGEPVVVTLLLGVPSAGRAPRPTRLIAPDGRQLQLGAELAFEDRSRARLSIDPAWLTPGRYLVEVKTTEATHFPLRRYVLDVR